MRLTHDQRDQAVEMIAQEHSLTEVASAVGCSANSLRRAMRIARGGEEKRYKSERYLDFGLRLIAAQEAARSESTHCPVCGQSIHKGDGDG